LRHRLGPDRSHRRDARRRPAALARESGGARVEGQGRPPPESPYPREVPVLLPRPPADLRDLLGAAARADRPHVLPVVPRLAPHPPAAALGGADELPRAP